MLRIDCGRIGALDVFARHGPPGPSAVEAHELSAMRVEDSRHPIPSILALRENHDYEAPGAHVLHVMPKVRGFLNGCSQSNQRSLELGQEAVFGSARIEATQVIFPMKDVNILSIDPGLKQCLDGRAGTHGIGDGADHPVRRVADESAWLVCLGVHGAPSLSFPPHESSRTRRCYPW